jgi:hypothetical protein
MTFTRIWLSNRIPAQPQQPAEHDRGGAEAASGCTVRPGRHLHRDEPGPYHVILANAVLQWMPDHETLMPRLVGKLTDGVYLAMQTPMTPAARHLLQGWASHP